MIKVVYFDFSVINTVEKIIIFTSKFIDSIF